MESEWDIPARHPWLGKMPSRNRAIPEKAGKDARSINERYQSHSLSYKRAGRHSAPSSITSSVDGRFSMAAGASTPERQTVDEEPEMADMQSAYDLVRLYQQSKFAEMEKFIIERMPSDQSRTMAMNYAGVQGYFPLVLLLIENFGADASRLNKIVIERASEYGDRKILDRLLEVFEAAILNDEKLE
jgi:hypothetical protein